MIEHMNPECMNHGGSGSAYANYGCRCDKCKAAQSVTNAKYQASRAATKIGATK